MLIRTSVLTIARVFLIRINLNRINISALRYNYGESCKNDEFALGYDMHDSSSAYSDLQACTRILFLTQVN